MFPLKDNIPTRRFAFLTLLIIVVNVVVFFAFEDAKINFSGEVNNQKVVEYGAIPYEITHPGKECFTQGSGTSTQVLCEGQSALDTSTGQTLKIRAQDIPRDQRDQPPWWVTIFTSMFMHGGILHIGGNMLFLW